MSKSMYIVFNVHRVQYEICGFFGPPFRIYIYMYIQFFLSAVVTGGNRKETLNWKLLLFVRKIKFAATISIKF